MAGPATSASEPRALQLVAVMVPRSSLGTMVARVWGRTPKITRSPSRACHSGNNRDHNGDTSSDDGIPCSSCEAG